MDNDFRKPLRDRRDFARHQGGYSSVQAALVFGALGLGIAVLSAPLLQGAADYYAENKAFGIDRVLTGSVDKPDRYRVQRSVLWEDTKTVCENRRDPRCDDPR